MNEKFLSYLEEKAGGDTLSILNVKGGAAIELFDLEIEKCLENIKDPNTDPKKKRSATLTLTFSSNDEGTVTEIDITPKSSLAGSKSQKVAARVFTDGNRVVAEEINRQLSMDEIWGGATITPIGKYKEENR
jgi:hypothetical protein